MSYSITPLIDLADALGARMEVDAVTSQLGGGIVNTLPDDPQLPIVRVIVRGKPIGPIAGSTRWDCEAEIDIYSDYAGDKVCLQVADAIVGAIEASGRLAADGWDVVVMNVLDLYEIPDELINDRKVKRWTLPVTLQVVKASS